MGDCAMDCSSHFNHSATFVSSFLYRVDGKHKNAAHQRLVEHPKFSRNTCSAVPSLESGDSSRFVDLRTLKTTCWPSVDQIHDFSSPSRAGNSNCASNVSSLNSVFNPNTIPFSSAEQGVVQTLLSGQSVLFSIAQHECISGLLLDLASRAKARQQTILYCASSFRAAECMYIVLKSALKSCTNEIFLETGDVNAKPAPSNLFTGGSLNPTSDSNLRPCIIVTVTDTLVRCMNSCYNSINILVLEQDSAIDSHWEEILLGLPRRITACLIGRNLDKVVGEHILLWLRSLHKRVVPFSSSCFSATQNGPEKSEDNTPQLFVFNTARHEKPVLFSLSKARSAYVEATLQKDVSYASALLHPSPDFEVLNAEELRFRNRSEAEFVDFATIILGDCVRTAQMTSTGLKKRSAGKRARTSTPTRSPQELRDQCFQVSNIFPVIALFNGEKSTISAANTVLNAADDPFVLLWDCENRGRLHDVLHAFVQNHKNELNVEDHTHLSFLAKGIGLIHSGVLPCIMMLAEELFRSGLINVLFADTHTTYSRLTKLPQAKSVLVQSSALGAIHDTRKGLVSGRVAMSLAHSDGTFGPANVVALWNDDSVDDEEAASEMAFGFVQSESTAGIGEQGTQAKLTDTFAHGFAQNMLGPVRLQPSSRSMWTTYSGVLRSMRCFGSSGFKVAVERTADYYQAWLGSAILRATREKMEADCKAIESRLTSAKQMDIHLGKNRFKDAEHDDDVVLDSLGTGGLSVVQHYTNEMLRIRKPGSLIGLRVRARNIRASQSNGDEILMWEPTEQVDFLPVIFVSLLANPSNVVKSYIGNSPLFVLCISTDGTWNAVPPSFVVSQAVEGSSIIAEVESFEVPHLATFDFDSSVGWAKRYPLPESTAALDAVRAGNKLRELCTTNQVEFQAITPRASVNRNSSHSSTSSATDNIEELHQMSTLREQFAKLSEQENLLSESEQRLNSAMNLVQEVRRDATLKIIGVLEDSNSIRIHDEEEIEMTPIGALASILPGPFPLFTSACLLLVQNIDELKASQFGAFVALIIGVDCEQLFLVPDQRASLSRQNSGMKERMVPERMVGAVEEILRSLHILAERHKSVNVPRADIGPRKLSIPFARVVFEVMTGALSLSKDLGNTYHRGAIIEEMRTVSQVLRIVSNGGAIGEFGSSMRQTAESALISLKHWPLYNMEDFQLLLEKGVFSSLTVSDSSLK